jgi:hypothetical protein
MLTIQNPRTPLHRESSPMVALAYVLLADTVALLAICFGLGYWLATH